MLLVDKAGNPLFFFFRKLKQLRSFHKRERGVGLTPDKSISVEQDLVSWMKTQKPIKHSDSRIEAEANEQEKKSFYNRLKTNYFLTRSSQPAFAKFTVK